MLSRKEALLIEIKKEVKEGKRLYLSGQDRATISEITPNLIEILRASSITNLTISPAPGITDEYNGDLVDMQAASNHLQPLSLNLNKPRHFEIHINDAPDCHHTVLLAIDLLEANLPCIQEICIHNKWLFDESELMRLALAIQKNSTINTLRIFNENFSLLHLHHALTNNKKIQTLSWGVRLPADRLPSFNYILFGSNIRSLFISQGDLRLIARILNGNSRLQQLVISSGEWYGAYQAMDEFFESLTRNSTLEFLKINFSGPPAESFPAFIQALQKNTGLRELILFNAPFYPKADNQLLHMVNLHPKLRARYYYGGRRDEYVFPTLVQKNIDYYLVNGQLELDKIQRVLLALEDAKRRVPADLMDYINEALRLFEALKYFSGGLPLTKDVVESFLLPFHYPKFQAIADLALGLLIATNPSIFEDWESMERYQFIFNKLKKAHPGSAAEHFLHAAWGYLHTKNELLMDLTNLRNTHALVSYEQIKLIVVHLINQSIAKEGEFRQRINLLNLLNKNSSYNLSFVSFLWRSPEFLNALYEQYPGMAVQIIEDYLLLSSRSEKIDDIDLSEVLDRVENSKAVSAHLPENTPSRFVEIAAQVLVENKGIPEVIFAEPSYKGLLDILQELPSALELVPEPEIAVPAPALMPPPPAIINPASFFSKPLEKIAKIYSGCTIL
ncbi:MAG: leucine-rich repeat domain-containing protein [Gammaproteobacteria bacterium]